MNALHFGAGNIGRGFIGKLLSDSNIHVTFADINDEIISLLNQQGYYSVEIVGDTNKIERVNNVSGINSKDENALLKQFTTTDLITTAVGPNVLKIIANTIAKGLEARFLASNYKPLNIIACENMVRASSFLKEQVLSYLSPQMQTQVEQVIGFIDSAVDRIVPPIHAPQNEPLQVTVEEFSEWIVDETQFKGEIPLIQGMEKTNNLMAFIERKLFTLNTGHAVAAYIGKYKGYQFIGEAIEDTSISAFVKEVMLESGSVLIQRYGFNPQTHLAYIEKILKRFANPYLIDDIDRVAREPLRKLSYNDRLIKPLRGTLEYDLPNSALLQAIAYALCYRNESDPQAIELANTIAKIGITSAVEKFTGLQDQVTIMEIVKIYQQLND